MEPTETGLKKSIMDATGPVRNYLKSNSIHDYSTQKQGPTGKVQLDSILYQDFKTINSVASLYRPQTKTGDPRIWFTKLSKIVNSNEILAIIWSDEHLHIINITSTDVKVLLYSLIANPIKDLIEAINSSVNSVADELLGLLKGIAKDGPIQSMLDADTSVGRTLETALGIPINSSKKPDYKGIELKSFRTKRANRKTLFAQVPNWSLSKFKSSSEILDEFGYQRDADFKLYCTVSAIGLNSQGLSLKVNTDINHLIETSSKQTVGDFAVWTLEKLHKRLLEKHKETFWVAADSSIINGKNHFLYKEVVHTKKPIVSQFDLLLEQGIITLDHLIKREPAGSAKEKGPLFKLRSSGLNLLFPPSKKYKLT
ncbi:MAG: MvaI/BcnI restriction endonuclease family protein [Cytophagales bacterium]|nr:MvaI/BcnI restriction endonuclease family protein [Cytophagales bacterium]